MKTIKINFDSQKNELLGISDYLAVHFTTVFSNENINTQTESRKEIYERKNIETKQILLLCAVMVLITMIPQNIKAITVEEAGNVYMTDSQAGKEKPLYGRLNINYTGNTNYDTWAYDIVTNYNTYDSKKTSIKLRKMF